MANTIELKTYGGKQYKVCNDTWYSPDTDDVMVYRLEGIRLTRLRVRFHWGNVQTGEDWGDIYDVAGRLGRSMGPVKAPLLIQTKRSMGGGIILDNCIVKITETTKPHKVIYQHPTYHVKEMSSHG